MSQMKNHTGYDAPAENVNSVTPADGSDLAHVSRALYIGGTGDVKIDTISGDTVTFTGVLAGSFLPIRVARVYSTGTTATNILSVY